MTILEILLVRSAHGAMICPSGWCWICTPKSLCCAAGACAMPKARKSSSKVSKELLDVVCGLVAEKSST